MGIYAFKSLLINALQHLQRLVSIRKRLKISQILISPAIPPLVKLKAFLNLLFDGLLWSTVRRIEGIVAAKSTTSRADFPISIRATEARVDADFLHTTSELLRKVVAVAVESTAIEVIQVCWDWGHIKTIPGSLIAQGLSGLNAANIQTFPKSQVFLEKNSNLHHLVANSSYMVYSVQQ